MSRLHLIAVLAPLLAGCASGPVFREPPHAAEVVGFGSGHACRPHRSLIRYQ